MLAQRISSMNSISAICEATGANIDEIALSIGMDPRIGEKYLKAGLGFGGSCFRKDVFSLIYLAESLHLEEVAAYWEQVLKMNEWQRTRFVKRIVKTLNGTLGGKKITILGYAFKKDTSDTRESPALEVIKILLEDRPAEIAVYDPFCNPSVVREEVQRLVGNGVERVKVESDPYSACEGSHAVIICTDCDEFKTVNPQIDLRGKKRGSRDPRPFTRLTPNESEILELHKFLASQTHMKDPLERFSPSPDCEEGCQKCRDGDGVVDVKKETERFDWSRIAYRLEKPKWVFDGRGVVDKGFMAGLGVTVQGIGR